MHNMLYKIHIPNRGNLEVVVHGFRIGVIDRERMRYLEYRNGKFLMKEIGEHDSIVVSF